MFLLKALATLQKKQTTPTGSLPPGPAQGGWGPPVPGRWGPKYTIHCV